MADRRQTSPSAAVLPALASVSKALPDVLPLPKAPRQLHVSCRVLRRWLEADLGVVFPNLGRGSSPLVHIGDVQAVILLRQGQRKYAPAEARDKRDL
jgi:hypothetical protein